MNLDLLEAVAVAVAKKTIVAEHFGDRKRKLTYADDSATILACNCLFNLGLVRPILMFSQNGPLES